jgi:hypothetical protein
MSASALEHYQHIDDVDDTSFSGPSTWDNSPNQGKHYFRAIVAHVAGSGSECPRPTLSGSLADFDIRDEHKFGSNDSVGLFVFSGVGTITEGADTFDFGATTINFIEVIAWECDEVNTGGTNGDAGIVQPSTVGSGADGIGTAPTDTLASFADATNNPFVLVACCTVNRDWGTPADGSSVGSDDTAVRLHVRFGIGEDLSLSVTLSSSGTWGALALELDYDAGATQTQQAAASDGAGEATELELTKSAGYAASGGSGSHAAVVGKSQTAASGGTGSHDVQVIGAPTTSQTAASSGEGVHMIGVVSPGAPGGGGPTATGLIDSTGLLRTLA